MFPRLRGLRQSSEWGCSGLKFQYFQCSFWSSRDGSSVACILVGLLFSGGKDYVFVPCHSQGGRSAGGESTPAAERMSRRHRVASSQEPSSGRGVKPNQNA